MSHALLRQELLFRIRRKRGHHSNVWDEYTDHTVDFYTWIQDENNVWEEWVNMEAGEDRLKTLMDLTGLNRGDAQKLEDELISLEKTWKHDKEA